MSSLIYDEQKIKEFHERILGYKRNQFDMDFLLLESRPKYLSEEEKKKYNIVPNYVTEVTPILNYDFDTFLNKVRMLDAVSDEVYDFDKNKIPKHCMCIYSNLNHINSLSSLSYLKEYLISLDKKIFDTFEGKETKESISDTIKNTYNIPFSGYYSMFNVVDKQFSDIDIDLYAPFEDYEDFYNEINSKIVNKSDIGTYFSVKDLITLIKTRYGLHLLINEEVMKEYNSLAKTKDGLFDKNKKISYNEFVKVSKDYFNRYFKNINITLSTDPRVPLPGTIQGGAEVKFV